jgi:hypothetical protein
VRGASLIFPFCSALFQCLSSPALLYAFAVHTFLRRPLAAHDKFEGGFAIKVRPIIMTDELAETIGFNSLIGMSVLWRAMASFDPYTETMEISPAFLKHGCAGFRITIPCVMSKPKPKQSAVLATLLFSQPQPQGSMSSYLPSGPTVACNTAKLTPRNMRQLQMGSPSRNLHNP